MSKSLEAAVWVVGLAVAGSGAIVASVANAPPDTGGDMWDSAVFFPTLLGMGVLAGIAGFRVPSYWPLFGAAVMVPYYAYQIAAGVAEEADGGSQGLWLVGLFFLVPLTGIPLAGGLLGASLRRGRNAAVG